jgi:hypothetical protein
MKPGIRPADLPRIPDATQDKHSRTALQEIVSASREIPDGCTTVRSGIIKAFLNERAVVRL